MPNDFVQYLSDRGLVPDALGAEIRTRATSDQIPPGRLLLEDGALAVRDVMQILTMQADAPGMRFGELAIREQLITAPQLEAALLRQRKARRHEIDVVLSAGGLFQDRLPGYVRPGDHRG